MAGNKTYKKLSQEAEYLRKKLKEVEAENNELHKQVVDLKYKVEYLQKVGFADLASSVSHRLIPWGGVAVITFFIGLFTYKTAEVLAGKTTYANIVTDIDTSFTLNFLNFTFKNLVIDFVYYLPIIIAIGGLLCGICGILYGKYQRKLRMDTVERLQSRIKKLEEEKDPKRSSSMLTPRGETRKEDL